MSLMAAVLLLRLIPYGLVAIYGARKGYRWLLVLGLYLIFGAVINLVFVPGSNIRALISSGTGLIVLIHVIDLKPRKGGDHVI